jgi:16S rRNA (uracil1498-N3)-methyltransferase
MADAKIRLCVEHGLDPGNSVPLDQGQANYLFNVMRLGLGAQILLFNSRDGEFLAEVADAGKRRGLLRVVAQTRPLQMPPDLWLLFAPIKKARTDFIVEKAAEMGAARICPVQTEYTNADRIRQDKLQAHAMEAAEQCGGTFVPPVDPLAKLGAVLDTWPEDRQLMFCDEARVGPAETLAEASGDKWAILIGPEGGFSPKERDRLMALPQAKPTSLGPRILRADTAAVAALTLWQSTLGDWQ